LKFPSNDTQSPGIVQNFCELLREIMAKLKKSSGYRFSEISQTLSNDNQKLKISGYCYPENLRVTMLGSVTIFGDCYPEVSVFWRNLKNYYFQRAKASLKQNAYQKNQLWLISTCRGL